MNSVERVDAVIHIQKLCEEMGIPTNRVHGLAKTEKAVLIYMAHRALQERDNVMKYIELLLLYAREVQR